MDLLLALSAVAEIAIFLLLTFSIGWIRVAYLPTDARGYALYRAISATIGVGVGGVFTCSIVAFSGVPIAFWLQGLRTMPLWARLVLAAAVLVEAVWVWLGLRRLRRARAEQEAEARTEQHPNRPFGSARPDPA